MWPLSKIWIATNYLQWILKAIVLSIIIILFLILFTCRIEEFKEMFSLLLMLIDTLKWGFQVVGVKLKDGFVLWGTPRGCFFGREVIILNVKGMD